MSPEQITARLALREAMRHHHQTRIEVARAARALRQLIELGPKPPAFLRRQAD